MSILQILPNHMNWLNQRFAVAAGNVANIDTPGYRARQVEDFAPVMHSVATELHLTNAGHQNASSARSSTFDIEYKPSDDETHSQNNVVLEDEMRVIGETSRQISMETSLYRIFHRMTISSLKVG
jgi:flagellar basal-body rod protein FlgB